MKEAQKTKDRGPNFLARAVARIALSVRSKLLISFLGITCLLVGLALFGLNALQQANERTEAMIRDQERIALFNDIHGAVAEIMAISLSLDVPPTGSTGEGAWFGALGWAIVDRPKQLQILVGQSVRKFGAPGMKDEQAIKTIRTKLDEIAPFTHDANRLRKEGDIEGSAAVGRDEIFNRLRVLQRDTYTHVQAIEKEMSARARITASAYLTSRQNILAAGIAAVGAALLLGFSLSSSLLWPITRIRSALSQISGGAFETRVDVPNRDELGALAGHVNDTSVRLAALYDEVESQKAQLAGWNTALEGKVAEQLVEIERSNRLRRFLPSQVADLITGAEDETDALRTRRADITVLFADLRGFTTFSNAAAPDQVIGALNAFHAAVGPLIEAHGGTLERFLGDGLMVLFGAPLPMEDAAEQAVALAKDMRPAVQDALAGFDVNGRTLGFGIGIATGPATLGQIGFEGRFDYSAIGPAPNLAARLCDEAKDGQILLSHSTVWQISAETRPAGSIDLKGVGDDISVFEAV